MSRRLLASLLSTHANHPAYLKVNGKPVVFFWQNSRFSVNDWTTIRQAVDPLHQSIWISEGTNLDYLRVFDGHHVYNIAWSADPRAEVIKWGQRVREKAIELGAFKYFVGTAMPGFDNRLSSSSPTYRPRSNGEYFRQSFTGVTQSNADWAVVTSFNEWVEGSQIEPSVTYGDQYLNLSAELANTYLMLEALNWPKGNPFVSDQVMMVVDQRFDRGIAFAELVVFGVGGLGQIVHGIAWWDGNFKVVGIEGAGFPCPSGE